MSRRRRRGSGSRARRSSTRGRCSFRSFPYVGRDAGRGRPVLADRAASGCRWPGRTRGHARRTASPASTCGCRATTCSSSSATGGTRPKSAAKARASNGSGRRRTRRLSFRESEARRRAVSAARSAGRRRSPSRSRSRSGSGPTVVDSFALPPAERELRRIKLSAGSARDRRDRRADHCGGPDVRAGDRAGAQEQRPARARHPRLPRVRPADIGIAAVLHRLYADSARNAPADRSIAGSRRQS